MFGLSDIARIAFKIFVLGIFFSIIYNFISKLNAILQELILNLFYSVSSLNNLDLGYFAGAIGLVDFLNNLMQSVLIAGNLFVSSVFTVIVFKHTAKIYTHVMRI